MASIIDSIRSVQTDRFAILKMAGFSFFIDLVYKLVVHDKNFDIYNITIYIAILILYLGYSSIIISNRINQRIETLPGFNIIEFIQNSFNSFVVILPYLILAIIIVNLVLSLFNFEGVPQQIAIWLIRYCIFCIFLTSLINYSENYNLAEAYDMSKILTGLADVLVYTILAVIFLALFTAFIAGPTLYLIYTFFNFGMLFEYFAAFFITLNLAILSDFWGQLHYDIQSRDNYY